MTPRGCSAFRCAPKPCLLHPGTFSWNTCIAFSLSLSLLIFKATPFLHSTQNTDVCLIISTLPVYEVWQCELERILWTHHVENFIFDILEWHWFLAVHSHLFLNCLDKRQKKKKKKIMWPKDRYLNQHRFKLKSHFFYPMKSCSLWRRNLSQTRSDGLSLEHPAAETDTAVLVALFCFQVPARSPDTFCNPTNEITDNFSLSKIRFAGSCLQTNQCGKFQ